MPIVMIADTPGMTEEAYSGMLQQLESVLKSSKGFIAHAGGPSPDGGWRVIEMWETEDDARRWFDEQIAPNLPPGVEPTRAYDPAFSAFTAQ